MLLLYTWLLAGRWATAKYIINDSHICACVKYIT
jgi:hypothetical protein